MINKILVVFGLLLFQSLVYAQSATCNGKFPNILTDYCWSAHFPIRMAGVEVFDEGQEDNDSSQQVDFVCTCGELPNMKIGTSISFWEGSHMMDVARNPFCLVGLGGIDLGELIDAPSSGQSVVDGGAVNRSSFFHVNWYANPILYFLGVVSDNSCLEQTPFDLYYSTSWDPLWNDEEMTMMLNPDAYLFANPAAMLATSADCIATSSGFPNNEIYWSAGCQGAMFPLTGTIPNHIGLADSSSLILQKFLTKGHRELLIWGTSYGGGDNGICYKYPKFMIDKTDYKYSMLFPTPQRKQYGLCSQPLGRSTMLWSAGTTFPFYGEDVAYQIFRKRDCCMGASVANLIN